MRSARIRPDSASSHRPCTAGSPSGSGRGPRGFRRPSTHDTKRGEDVRARLNVLSEIPGAWKAAALKWRALNRKFKTELGGALAPDPNEEYLLYQTLVGAWPFEPGEDGRPFVERICAYMTKALRESKVHTSWLSPDEAYEDAVHALRQGDSRSAPRRPFLDAFLPFQARVAELGIYNGLAQLLIKITAPGIPDFYQGTELWDLNLVDPDNRRPVDYARRRQILDTLRCRRDDDDGRMAAELLAAAERRPDQDVRHGTGARGTPAPPRCVRG